MYINLNFAELDCLLTKYQPFTKSSSKYADYVGLSYCTSNLVSELLETEDALSITTDVFDSTDIHIVQEFGDLLWFFTRIPYHLHIKIIDILDILSFYPENLLSGKHEVLEFKELARMFSSLLAKYIRGDFDQDTLVIRYTILLAEMIKTIIYYFEHSNTDLSVLELFKLVVNENVNKITRRLNKDTIKGSGEGDRA